MCPTPIGRVHTRVAIIVGPALLGLILSLVTGRADWIVLIGVYLLLGVFLDTCVYSWLLKYQPPWMTGVLALAEFGLLYVLANVLKLDLSPAEAIAFYWASWVLATVTRIVVLPNLSLTYIESAGEFRRIEWSLPPEQTPVPVLASVPDSASARARWSARRPACTRCRSSCCRARRAHDIPARRGRPSGSRLSRSGRQLCQRRSLRSRAGDRVGPYRIEERLGEGGMGLVFEARGSDGREVALKIVAPSWRTTCLPHALRARGAAPPGGSTRRTSCRCCDTGEFERHPLHGAAVHLRRDAEGPDRARGLACRSRPPCSSAPGGEGPRRAARRGPHPPRREAGEHPARRRRRLPTSPTSGSRRTATRAC